MCVIKEIKATAISLRQKKKPLFWITFTSFYKPWKPGCSVFRLTFSLQKRKCTTARKKECGGNKKYLNETSAPIYLWDALAFVVFKCRVIFTSSAAPWILSGIVIWASNSKKEKNPFFIMEADKMGRGKKSSFCSDLSDLKTYFNSCKYVFKPLTNQKYASDLPF